MKSKMEKQRMGEFKANEDLLNSHSLRTALYCIKGMIETHLICAEDGTLKDGSERLQHAEHAMRKVHGYADKAMSILKRLSSGFMHGDPESKKSRVSLTEVWKDVIGKRRKQLAGKQIQVISRIPDSFPALYCSGKDLAEMMDCLLSNAIDAAGNCGNKRVKIVIRAEMCFTTAEETYAVITLADTGTGIPVEVLGRLFEPFFSTKEEFAGNGLGLFVAKKLAIKNGGRIKVSSYPKEGTTFTLELPLASSGFRS